jgi:hypothetical protein
MERPVDELREEEGNEPTGRRHDEIKYSPRPAWRG